MIRIVNLRNYNLHEGEVLIKVDRSTAVGNPFFMRDESMRDEVCDKYAQYFDKMFGRQNEFTTSIHNIVRIAKEHNVALGCWCAPKRCHAETIKKYIESVL